MSNDSPIAIVYDVNGNAIGSVQDGAFYRLRVESSLVSGEVGGIALDSSLTTINSSIGTTNSTLTGGTQKTQIFDGTNVIGTVAHPVAVNLVADGYNNVPVSQSVAANLNATVVQSNAANLNTTVTGTVTLGSASNIIGQVEITDGYNLLGTQTHPFTSNHSDLFNDAFGRFRVSEPIALFDNKQLIDNAPLYFDDQQTSGSGTSSTYNTNQASTTISVSSTTAGTRVRQSFRRFNYQPGKSIGNNERVLTSEGYKLMGEISTNDIVFDANGEMTRIKYVAPQGERPLYRFTFDDGTTVDADEEHLWVTIIRNSGKKTGNKEILTTKQMLERFGSHPRAWQRWRIPASPVLNIPEKEVPLNPYMIGALLGDGSMMGSTPSFTTADTEILQWLDGTIKYKSKYDYSISGISKQITELDMHHRCENKFVPKEYLYNHKSIRLAVLQGLMDTDGTVDKNDGTAEFNTASIQLAKDVEFLVRSLGGQIKWKKRSAGYKKPDGEFKKCLDSYRIRIIMPICPFRLARKANLWKKRERISFDRYVHSIEYIGVGLATCIAVESEDRTFLTAGHIVTHNSQAITCTGNMLGGQAGITKKIGYFDGYNGLFFALVGTTFNVGLRTNTSGTPTDILVPQSSWNLDTMDGYGPSGIKLDLTKTQIFYIDFQWLGVGRVRYGFVGANGMLVYCHQIVNSNTNTVVYMSTPNLPVRYEISNSGTGVASSLVHICSSVISEGGFDENGIILTQDVGTTGLTTGNNTSIYPLIALRLLPTAPYATVFPLLANIISSTANIFFRYALYLNPTIAGTALSFGSVSGSYCQVAIATNGSTITGGTGTLIMSGYGANGGAANGNSPITFDSISNLNLGQSIAGTSDIFVLAVQNIVNGTNTYYGSLSWREIL